METTQLNLKLLKLFYRSDCISDMSGYMREQPFINMKSTPPGGRRIHYRRSATVCT